MIHCYISPVKLFNFTKLQIRFNVISCLDSTGSMLHIPVTATNPPRTELTKSVTLYFRFLKI